MPKEKKEVRIFLRPMECESRTPDDRPGSIFGYPIVYDKDSEDMGFIERIAVGAAKNAIKKSDIRGLKNHDPSLIFGRKDVNMKFQDTKEGLRYEATPINTSNFNEIAEEVRLGLLTGQSFGFTVKSDKWEGLDTDKPVRTITEIDKIFDVGPVTYPAYPDTSIALRSLAEAKEKVKDDPPFELVTVTINGEIFEINDLEAINNKLELIRSGSDQTDDEPEDDPDKTKDGDEESGKEVLERIFKMEEKYKE